jgi:hypothetical protein
MTTPATSSPVIRGKVTKDNKMLLDGRFTERTDPCLEGIAQPQHWAMWRNNVDVVKRDRTEPAFSVFEPRVLPQWAVHLWPGLTEGATPPDKGHEPLSDWARIQPA